MPSSLISLGANLGNTLETMRAASRLFQDSFGGAEVRLSSIFRTPAVGGPGGQGDFLNAMARVDHGLSVWEVWERIKRIETELGRQRLRRWESRRIDIDLILHDQELVWTPHLKVPHPRMSMRTFVLRPACEIAADLVDPVTGLTIRQLASRLDSLQSPRIAIACSTESLRQQIQSKLESSPSVPLDVVSIHGCVDPVKWWSVWPEADLHMACVEVPDPENIQWEDYCLPWAVAMGFTKSASVNEAVSGGTPIWGFGARYLLPGTDIEWVCHEIQAARLALRCPVQATGASWVT
ncbi:MAG: 2-amino-4-hydroxy-6-hydroxymethyldihydropteridine diphosphokinase [Planctomycetota bacterium]